MLSDVTFVNFSIWKGDLIKVFLMAIGVDADTLNDPRHNFDGQVRGKGAAKRAHITKRDLYQMILE